MIGGSSNHVGKIENIGNFIDIIIKKYLTEIT
jgi:hypothetical protein